MRRDDARDDNGDAWTRRKKKSFGALVPAPFAFLVLLSLVVRSNLLLVLSVSSACILSVAILVSTIRYGRVSLSSLISYAVLLVGAVTYQIVFGAMPFWDRVGYNLMTGSFAIVSLALFFGLRARVSGRHRIISVALGILLVLSSFFYLLTMNIRSHPRVESLQEGHDSYLSGIRNLTYPDTAPHVLIINMDDMGYSDISLFSYLGPDNATFDTPNIDSLAEDGVVMTNFYTSSAVCSPSRFGLLTGRYQSRGYLDRVLLPTDTSLQPYNYQRFTNSFFFRNNVDGILSDEITLAEVAQAYGYRTALIGKWHLGDYGQYLPGTQGFDYFFGSYYSNDMIPYELVREQDGRVEGVFTHDQMRDQSVTNEIYSEEVLEFLSTSIRADESFFLLYNSPWPHARHYAGEVNDRTDDTYIDAILEFDAYLGDILELLREEGVYDDTLLLFMSDNGSADQGSTGPLKGKKDTTFEGGHKVPMIARYPNGGLGGGPHFAGVGWPRRVEARAMNIDLFPTILSYMGIEQLPEDRIIDGVNLYDLLQGNVTSNAALHDALFYIKNGEVQAIQKPVMLGGRTVDMKYFEAVSSEFVSLFMFSKRRNLLFNLDKDPAEAYNIANRHPGIARQLNADLRAFAAALAENRRGIVDPRPKRLLFSSP